MDTGENVMFSLRGLYGKYGYSRYKMNKFEEYDLYAHNKDFLISDSVITFTDGSGKLLALKPDVTLSIVKNTKDGGNTPQKLYYNENVYRVAKGSRNFKEIMQAGLECIGNVDNYCIYEVLKLALGSLDIISGTNVLGVSHLGILSEVMDYVGVPSEKKTEILRCAGEKNLHELSETLRSIGADAEKARVLTELLSLKGETDVILPKICGLIKGAVSEKTLSEFTDVISALDTEKKLKIDFSVVGDLHYYNGFVFKGFVEGIPNSVLSGGQYDMLMKKMGRRSGAIGFAVYLDTVEQFFRKSAEYDADALLVYGKESALSDVAREVGRIGEGGAAVLCVTDIPEGIKYKKLYRMKDGRAEEDEANS